MKALVRRLGAVFPPAQVLRFGAVGVTATAVHFLVLNGLVGGLGLAPALATGLAFLCAVGVTYVGQAVWVFGQPLADRRRLQRFAASALSGLLANVGLMALFVDGIGWHHNLGFAVALIVVPGLQFLLNKFWVFRTAPAK